MRSSKLSKQVVPYLVVGTSPEETGCIQSASMSVIFSPESELSHAQSTPNRRTGCRRFPGRRVPGAAVRAAIARRARGHRFVHEAADRNLQLLREGWHV